MRSRLVGLLLAVSLVAACGLAPAHVRVVDSVNASVVRVTGTKMMMTWFGPMQANYVCTGFVIAPQRVLTAAHCIGDNMLGDGQAVEVLKEDEFNDLALLKVETEKRPLPTREWSVVRGEAVTGVGYGLGLTATTPIEGKVILVDYQVPQKDKQGKFVLPPLIFVQGAWIGGMSGGPVVDAYGRVVGIVQMTAAGTAGLGVGTLIIRAFLLGAL